MVTDPDSCYRRYRRALGDEPLPAALCDLDALDDNADRLLAQVRARGRRLRVATKSLRCPGLIRRVVERGGDAVIGLMTYTAAETALLAAAGHADLVLAYPTVQAADLRLLAEANRGGARATAMVDCPAHVDALAAAADAAGVVVPAMIDVDVGYRPLPGIHLGVRRSPLRAPEEVVALARRIASLPSLSFRGVMGYEAQIAGLPDDPPGGLGPALRLLKRRSRPDVARRRRGCLAALAAAGLRPGVVNGGGTGSLASSLEDPSLTEVTVGSGFLGGLLFDAYRGLPLAPALHFALQVTRRPAPGIVTCLGGGLVASGSAGADRLPRPCLPAGLALLPAEGAGEVQTPLRVVRGADPAIGDPVFFRHAKAGELAEHFAEYLLVRGDRLEGRAPTYRGLGQCFLG